MPRVREYPPMRDTPVLDEMPPPCAACAGGRGSVYSSRESR